MTDTDVQITADALTSLRSTSPLAVELGLDCPYDSLFANEAGRGLAEMALSLDPVYEQYNMVRYKWFTERLNAAAEGFEQIVLLGVGFDTRALTLPALTGGDCQVFEADFPDTLSQKHAVLARAEVAVPPYIHFVPIDLADGDPAAALRDAGLKPDMPAAVFMEGVSFFLPRETAQALVDPKTLGLIPGSRFAIDCWTRPRADGLNAKLEAKTGNRLFGASPFGDSASDIETLLTQQGYRDSAVSDLGSVAGRYGLEPIADPLGESWFVVDTRLR
ncbi:MAG: class I SAM-dependent methyltransferase [Alphaproteobacteria bacterium]|nr:class I SAM-dependent methyltransferase [Alphaproteobacteria bacterium]